MEDEHNTSAYKELEEQRTILNHIVSITESRDVEILEISMLRTIYEVIPCKNVYMLKTVSEDLQIQSISCYGVDGYRTSCEMDFCHDCSDIKELLALSLKEHKGITVKNTGYPFTVCPVDIINRNIGFIAVDAEDVSPLNIHVLESLIRIYQNYVSVLLDNQRDTLTGLLNRKTFDDRIIKLIELRKKQKPGSADYENERRKNGDYDRFWLGILDIDNFKRVNDTFGHIYGDEILILLSRIMQDIFRANDMKFRFGGEEFIVVIKAEDTAMAYGIFERFRKSVEEYHFPQTGKVTISIGLVEITGDETTSVFVGCADKALYYAKEHGRNMTCIYSDLVERGLIQPEQFKKGDVFIFDE